MSLVRKSIYVCLHGLYMSICVFRHLECCSGDDSVTVWSSWFGIESHHILDQFVRSGKFHSVCIFCRHVVCFGGWRVSSQTPGCSECGSCSESAEFRVLDQSLNPGIIHFILGLLHPVTWRRQQEPHPECTGRRTRAHSHRCANTSQHWRQCFSLKVDR